MFASTERGARSRESEAESSHSQLPVPSSLLSTGCKTKKRDEPDYRCRHAEKQPLRIIAFGPGVDLQQPEHQTQQAQHGTGPHANDREPVLPANFLPPLPQLLVDARRKLDLDVELFHRTHGALDRLDVFLLGDLAANEVDANAHAIQSILLIFPLFK